MIGTTIAHYKILEKLGEGGMGVVYKAQDTNLDRFVALKFLPPHVASSIDDKARFLQEAKAVASLAHPNICTIYSVEEVEGKAFIVMEYVEGKTLRDLEQNIPLKQAVEIGTQIADGLAAAHEKGIIHRDIKPDNIMIRKDGRVQIMDFGLAKLKGASRLTKEGKTIGTAGYMSPEQVQGQETDHRTDIFSLGVVLYELFAGESPFKGVHETAITYEIVNVDPAPLSAVKPNIDTRLDAIVLECLEKEPSERYQSAAEIGKELRRFKRESSRTRASRVSWVGSASRSPAIRDSEAIEQSAPRSIFSREYVGWWAAIAVLLAAGLTVTFIHFQETSPERQTIRFSIPMPQKTSFDIVFSTFAISPDGRQVVFSVLDSLGSHLWVRPLKSMTAAMLAGTDWAWSPFWSPDSRSIGFFSGGKLKKIEASGGPAITLCDAANPRGGSWNSEGDIIFADDYPGSLYRISAGGGSPMRLTQRDSIQHESSYRFPSFLPDGNHFLYYGIAGESESGIYVGSLDAKTHHPLVTATSCGVYVHGNLLFLREQTLMAQPFDESTLALKGDAIPVAEDVAGLPGMTGSGLFSASLNGILMYQPQSGSPDVQPIWYDRSGRQTGTVGDPGSFGAVRISPDGRRVAASVSDAKSKNDDIWIYDLERRIRTRFTSDPKRDWLAVWSPDGKDIIFASERKGNVDIYRRPSSGVSPEEPLLQTPSDERPSDWSRDGKYILYFSLGNPKTGSDIWVLPLVGDRKPFPFLKTEFNESTPRFSPDGRWVAYRSDESGKNEIYVRPFPGPGPQLQVSITGGSYPRWRGDGREVYFLSPEGIIMAAQVNSSETKFEVGKVASLFQVRLGTSSNDPYDVSADGQRFLVISALEGKVSSVFNVVVNWDAELKKK